MPHRSFKVLRGLVFGGIVAILAGCSTPSDRMVIALIEGDTTPQDFSAQIDASGGTLAGPILRNAGHLPNDALPAGTIDLGASLVSMAHFPNILAEQAFIAELESQPDVAFLARGRRMGRLPFIGQTEPLEALGTVKAPAFVLLNLIDQRPLINPVNATRMLSYMRGATPRLSAESVAFVSPILINNVVVGDLATDLMFLTIWPDKQTFDRVHNDPGFVDLANRTRNRVFQSLTENAAIPQSVN
jgi:hypothetical protein